MCSCFRTVLVLTPESQHPLLCYMGVVATLFWLSISTWYLFSHGVYFHTHDSSHGSACHEKAVTAWEPKMAVLVTDFRQHPLLYTIAMDAALVLVTQTMLYMYWRQLKHSEHTRLHRHILLYT